MPVAARRGAAIEISHLRKTFESGKNSIVAIDDLSISIASGEFVCFVGPSGCGKSTLLRILAGLETADSGEVTMDAGEADVQNAMVFQEASIFPWKTVGDNIAFGLRARGLGRDECVARVDAALRMVGLTRFRDHYPSQISGGMKQRAAIARALVMNPAVLLMDEPFAALDAQNRAILQAELANICEQAGTTVVYITHSLEEALMLGDRTVVLTAQPARIKDVVIVPFARPRDTIEVSATPEFGELKLRMWNVLEAEVLAARREHEGI
jgi:NitT/TauT family transport system ATP-binding protein